MHLHGDTGYQVEPGRRIRLQIRLFSSRGGGFQPIKTCSPHLSMGPPELSLGRFLRRTASIEGWKCQLELQSNGQMLPGIHSGVVPKSATGANTATPRRSRSVSAV